MTTIKDVARMAGVSTSTVSRALSGKIPLSEATKENVLQCIKALNYQPNALAKGLKEGKSKTIAFVIPNIENLIYPTLAIAVETEARKNGYFVLFCNTQEDQAREQDYVDKLKNHFVDGFIFSTALAGTESNTILELKKEGYPTVCLMRATNDQTDTIISDNEYGAYSGVSFLIKNGFRNIATITGRSSILLYNERLSGYKRALQEFDIPLDQSLIWSGVEGETEKAFHCVLDNLQAGIIPDAIFAQSDPMAFDAMKAIAAAGLKVPDDISVLGFDNVPFASNYIPALTTVEQPLYDMGIEATQRLIDIIEQREEQASDLRVFPPKLIVRDSVKLKG